MITRKRASELEKYVRRKLPSILSLKWIPSNKHTKIILKDKKGNQTMVVVSSTPSDHRTYRNIISHIRKKLRLFK